MSVKYKLHQDNRSQSKFKGQYYARGTWPNKVGVKELADDIEAATAITKHDVKAVLSALAERMAIHLKAGDTVRLDGLGTFKITFSSKPAATPHVFNAAKHIYNPRVLFQQEYTGGQSGTPRTRAMSTGVKFEEYGIYNNPDNA